MELVRDDESQWGGKESGTTEIEKSENKQYKGVTNQIESERENY